MTQMRMQAFQKLACVRDNDPENLRLVDLVNLTDFLGITDACSLYEIDSLKHCDAAVRQENAKNYEFEFR